MVSAPGAVATVPAKALRFSVVLATYNGRRYLRECIESVLRQTWRDFEFIIVDDGSTDGSKEIIAEFVQQEPGLVRAIRLAQNAGQGPAFNAGVAAARGELVAFIDSDDVWFPDKLARVAATFPDHGEVVVHQHQLKLMRDEVLTDSLVRPALAVGDVFVEATRTRQLPQFVPTSGLTFTRRVLRQIGPIPASFRICADGFLTRAAISFGKVAATMEVCAAYRVHGANETYENPRWDVARYIRELLVPELNAFYRRKGVPFAFPDPTGDRRVMSTARESIALLGLRDGDRVLVVRSAPVERVAAVLAGLFAVWPGVQVELLLQPGFETAFSDPRITPVTIAAGMMSPGSIPAEVRARLASNTYAAMIAVYNEVDGSKYGNLHLTCFTLPLSCPIVAVTTENVVQEIRRPVLGIVLRPDDERVLVLRSAQVDRVWGVLAALFQARPRVRVELLVQPGFEKDFRDPRIELVTIGEGMMSPAAITDTVRATLQSRNYACVVAPYSDPFGRGYDNVHATMLSLPVAARKFGVGSTLVPFPISEPREPSRIGVRDDAWSVWRDIHRGRRAFVIGNGPSLTMADLTALRDEITFASNKIYLAFDQTPWRPTYYCMCDEMVAANNAERIRQVESQMFLPWPYRKFHCAGPRIVWYEEKFENKFATLLPPEELERAVMHFSEDAARGVYAGYTVIYNQLQIAYHMGIREVYLIGIDFSFQVPVTRTVDARFQSADYRNALLSQGEQNHFHPDYRKPGETWTLPRLEVMACGYKSARLAFEEAGGRVINASRKSALTVLERESFDEVIARRAPA